MNKKKQIAAALMLVFGAAGAAQAIELKYVSTDGLNLVTTNTPMGYLGGEMNFLTGTGSSFAAWCVEITQGNASAAAGLQTYTIGSFTSSQSTLLQGLFSSSYAAVSTTEDKAAFQTAIWEIMQEPAGSTLDVNTGGFQFGSMSATATDAEIDAFASKINSYLDAASNYSGAPQYTLTKLVNGSYQDYVTVSAVPEPESYAMLLAGLAAMSLIVRRRARR